MILASILVKSLICHTFNITHHVRYYKRANRLISKKFAGIYEKKAPAASGGTAVSGRLGKGVCTAAAALRRGA